MNDHKDLISKNYDLVYDHFKEQDQLRNTSFGFFTTLTVAVLGFIDDDNELMPVSIIIICLFLLGILFSFLLCRYKYYGNIYSITMKVYRRLLAIDDDADMKKAIDEAVEKGRNRYDKNFYSADYLIYLCLILINTLNLIMICRSFSMNLIWIGITVAFYLFISNLIYYLLVIQKSRNCTAKDLHFLDSLYPGIYEEPVKKVKE